MRASAIVGGLLAALAALAAAAPAEEPRPSETIHISSFIVRKESRPQDSSPQGTSVKVVDFKLTGRDARDLGCTAQNPAFPKPTEAVTCGDSKYRFSLHLGTGGNEFSLRIYHELGFAFGYQGLGNVPTHCRAGGNGPYDYVCEQASDGTVIVIDNTPPPVDP